MTTAKGMIIRVSLGTLQYNTIFVFLLYHCIVLLNIEKIYLYSCSTTSTIFYNFSIMSVVFWGNSFKFYIYFMQTNLIWLRYAKIMKFRNLFYANRSKKCILEEILIKILVFRAKIHVLLYLGKVQAIVPLYCIFKSKC